MATQPMSDEDREIQYQLEKEEQQKWLENEDAKRKHELDLVRLTKSKVEKRKTVVSIAKILMMPCIAICTTLLILAKREVPKAFTDFLTL